LAGRSGGARTYDLRFGRFAKQILASIKDLHPQPKLLVISAIAETESRSPTRMASSKIWLWIGSFIGSITITALVYVVGRSVSAIVEQLAALQIIKP
jgi:hypothetical protein